MFFVQCCHQSLQVPFFITEIAFWVFFGGITFFKNTIDWDCCQINLTPYSTHSIEITPYVQDLLLRQKRLYWMLRFSLKFNLAEKTKYSVTVPVITEYFFQKFPHSISNTGARKTKYSVTEPYITQYFMFLRKTKYGITFGSVTE